MELSSIFRQINQQLLYAEEVDRLKKVTVYYREIGRSQRREP